METLRLCVFLALIVTLRAYELSQNQSEFYCTFNGNLNNSKQIETYGANRTFMQVVLQPILTTLSDVPVIYMQNYDNGVLARSYVLIVTKGGDGTMFTTPFNFPGNTDIKQGPVDPKVIKSLTWNDLKGRPDCKDSYTRVKPFDFLLTWQDCKDPKVKGKRENYSASLTCDSHKLIVPPGAGEVDTLTPYELTRYGKKYPLENAPDNYVCNCDKPSS